MKTLIIVLILLLPAIAQAEQSWVEFDGIDLEEKKPDLNRLRIVSHAVFWSGFVSMTSSTIQLSVIVSDNKKIPKKYYLPSLLFEASITMTGIILGVIYFDKKQKQNMVALVPLNEGAGVTANMRF
jgi:hypothetical protein